MLSNYNGFIHNDRMLSWKIQKRYNEYEILNWKHDTCEMCKQDKTTILPHLENYFNPLEYYPLCIECHMKLHGRFRCPDGWLHFLQNLHFGYKPKKWTSVSSYFGSTASKQYFKKVSQLIKFDLIEKEWFTKLSLKPYDLKSELIAAEKYSNDHLNRLWDSLKKNNIS